MKVWAKGSTSIVSRADSMLFHDFLPGRQQKRVNKVIAGGKYPFSVALVRYTDVLSSITYMYMCNNHEGTRPFMQLARSQDLSPPMRHISCISCWPQQASLCLLSGPAWFAQLSSGLEDLTLLLDARGMASHAMSPKLQAWQIQPQLP